MSPEDDSPTAGLVRVRNRVRIPRSYALGTMEVTVGQFRKFLKAHPARARHYPGIETAAADQPVTNVRWLDATQYCRWLGEHEGIQEEQQCYPAMEAWKEGASMLLPTDHLRRTGYRLPTEAEWFYACRGSSVSGYSFGWPPEGNALVPGGIGMMSLSLSSHYAWTGGNSGNHPWPVGQLKPNRHGLFDMYGNVWEWCHDAQGISRPRPVALVTEDRETPTTLYGEVDRMRLGGSFSDFLQSMQYSLEPNFLGIPGQVIVTGFRVARTLP
jgi:formylglycine-generating enzyme required for sulfatase activity